MQVIPFAIRRPWLLMRNVMINRDKPNLERLRKIQSPERFVWAVLPHAARTFSACIVMLPASVAKAAAVGYLYCRILDTYEDLSPSADAARDRLRAFARRFHREGRVDATNGNMPSPEQDRSLEIAELDDRERAHMLLIERCGLIDRVFVGLPESHRRTIVRLVRDMAAGMVWAKRVFEEQNGVLQTREQLRRYCNGVLGNPVAFATRLMVERELTPVELEHAMDAGELIQLANVTRDIEADLSKGVAYHPLLREHLRVRVPPLRFSTLEPSISARGPVALEGAVAAVRNARTQLFEQAMTHALSYRRLVEPLPFRTWSLSRASAMLMLDFTNRYYSGCAARIGRSPWRARRPSWRLILGASQAFFSRRATTARMVEIEEHFLAARASA